MGIYLGSDAVSVYAGGVAIPSARGIDYDNTISGLTTTNVQDAIDEVVSICDNLGAAEQEKEVFMVTLQWDESDLENPKWVPDKTYSEITEAYNSGKYVYCKTTDGMTETVVPLIFVDVDSVYFQYIDFTGVRSTFICNSSDEWTNEVNDFVPYSDSSNAGQILMVDSDGIPQWTAITNAEGVAY